MTVRPQKDQPRAHGQTPAQGSDWATAGTRAIALALLLAAVPCVPIGCGWGLTFRSYDVKDQAPQPPESQTTDETAESGFPETETAQMPTDTDTRPGNPEAWGRGAQLSVGRNFDPIYFDPGSSELDYTARNRLKDYAEWLKGHPSVWVTLAGYAATDGTDEFALNLSMARALAVKDFLLGQSLSPTRMFTISYGDLTGATAEEPSPAAAPGETLAPTMAVPDAETTLTTPVKAADARVNELERRVEILAFIAPIGVNGPESVPVAPGDAPGTQQPQEPPSSVDVP